MRPDQVITERQVSSNGAVATVKTRAKSNARNSSKTTRIVMRSCPACSNDYAVCRCVKAVKGNRAVESRAVRKYNSQRKHPPSPRLVGIETNPGPKRSKFQPRQLRPKKQGARAQRRKAGRANPVGPNRMRVRRGTGRLGLSSNPSTGVTSRFNQTIEEDEYIADVNGSSGFVTTAYNINPGNVTTFPWGSRISQLYDKYDFQMLEFYYKRIASEFNTSASTGNVILSIDYNATDAAPTTLQQVLATLTKNVGMPCDEIIPLQLDCKLVRDSPSKYVLAGAQPANTDAKTYNAGVLYVTTQGTGTSNTLGRLFVRYRCVLKEPVLEPATVAGGVLHFSGTAPTTANNFATAVLQAGGTPSLVGVTAAANVITFPAGLPGNYLIQMNIGGSTSASAFGAPTTTGTFLYLFTFGGARDAQPYATTLAATTTSVAGVSITVTIPVGGATVTISPSTLVGGNVMDLFIVSLPTALITSKVPFGDDIEQLRCEIADLRALVQARDSPWIENDDAASSSGPAVKLKQQGVSEMSSSLVTLVGDYVARKSSSTK